MIVLLASIGVVWMIVCATRGHEVVMAHYRTRLENFVREKGRSPSILERAQSYVRAAKEDFPIYWKDFIWSIILTAAGAFVFKGVSGMIIGLLASVLLSLWVELSETWTILRARLSANPW